MLQLNTIVNYIDEVCYRFMRNLLGLGKETPESRFMVAIAKGDFRCYDDKIIKSNKEI